MSNDKLKLNANQVVAFLQKSPQEFTKADIMRFVEDNGIKMVNFLYPGGDGKLKTLNFVITDRAYLLFEGKILFHGTPEELAANPIVRQNYLGRDFELKKKTRVD